MSAHLILGCLVMVPTQVMKHVFNQPGDVFADATKLMLNPLSRKWNWLVRNLRLRTTVVLTAVRVPAPRRATPVSSDAAVIVAAIRRVWSTAGQSLPPGITAKLIRGPDDDDDEVKELTISWAKIHESHAESEPLLAAMRSRFLAGPEGTMATDNVAAAPGGAAGDVPPVGGASHPPADAAEAAVVAASGAAVNSPARSSRGRAAPSSTPALASAKSTRGKRPATYAGSVAKSVKSLRSSKLQAKLKQTNHAAVTAIMQDDPTDVVSPPYIIAKVPKNLVWPHGGIAVFVQFPFLLDTSWKHFSKYIVHCRKTVCNSDDVDGEGGLYELFVILTTNDDKRNHQSGSVRGPVSHGSGGPRSTADSSPRQFSRATSGRTVGDTGGTGATGEMVGGTDGAGSTGGVGGTGGAGGAAPQADDAVRVGSAGGATVVGGSPMSSRRREKMPRTAPTTVDSDDNGDDDAYEDEEEGSASSKTPAAGGTDAMLSPSLPSRPSAERPSAALPPSGRPTSAPVTRGGPAGPSCSTVDTDGLADAAAVELQESNNFEPMPIGLQNMFLRLVGKDTASLGLAAAEKVQMAVLKCSAPSSFSLHTSFMTMMELDTTETASFKRHNHEYIYAAFPAAAPRVTTAVDLTDALDIDVDE